MPEVRSAFLIFRKLPLLMQTFASLTAYAGVATKAVVSLTSVFYVYTAQA